MRYNAIPLYLVSLIIELNLNRTTYTAAQINGNFIQIILSAINLSEIEMQKVKDFKSSINETKHKLVASVV